MKKTNTKNNTNPPQDNIKKKIPHLEWAVNSRYQNQLCAVKLLKLFEGYKSQFKSQKWSRIAQNLVAVSFSLWRAAFLADKISKRSIVLIHAKTFLVKIVEDNAISYPQDRNSNEWTFNYYTKSAKHALIEICKNSKNSVPPFEERTRNPKERWEYYQELLEKIVEGLTTEARKQRDQERAKKRAQKAKATGLSARERKKKSRAFTIGSRKGKTQSEIKPPL